MIREMTGSKQQPKKTRKRHRKRKPERISKLRCFVGIPAVTGLNLEPLQQQLAQLAADPVTGMRPAPVENLHVTLKFFGSIGEQELGPIEARLVEMVTHHQPFGLSIDGLGFFKNSVWVGVKETLDTQPCHQLARAIDQSVAELGIAQDTRTYTPHVTVARFAADAKMKLSRLREQFTDCHWGDLNVSKICLYKSETLPEGARYSILREFKLGAVTNGD